MPEGLKIQVEADVQKAVKALSQEVPQAADKAAESAKKLGDSFEYAGLKSQHMAQGAGKAFQGMAAESKVSSKAVNILEGSIEDLQARIGARKSFLNTETDIKKIAALNKEISFLEQQVSILSNTGKVRFDQFGKSISNTASAAGLAAGGINNVSVSIEGIGKGAQKAIAGLLRISYLLPGLGFAGLIGGIATVAGALVGLGGSADKTVVDFSGLAKSVEEQVAKQKELSQAAESAASSVLSEAKSLKDLRGILQSTTSSVSELTSATIKQGVARLIFSQKESELQKVLSAEIERQFLLRSMMGSLRSPEFISDPDLNRLKQLQKANRELGSTNPRLDATIKRIEELNTVIGTSKGLLSFFGSISQGFESLFKGFVDGKKDVDNFTDDTIENAKKISDSFKNIIDLQFDPSVLDTQAQKLAKAKDFLAKFSAKQFKFKQLFDLRDIQIPPEEVKPVATEFGVMFSKELNAYFKSNTLFDPSIALAQTLEAQRKAIGGIFGIQSNEDSIFTKAQREAIVTAQTIQGVLTPAFQDLFNAILEGENPLKAFFSSLAQSVAQLIQKLISAAITAAILSAIFPAGLGGAKGFGSIFGKLLGFAQGGLVYGPTLGLIGEGRGTSQSNPEVIAPLDQLQAMLGDVGGGRQVVTVTGRLRGNDMILQNARTSRAQGRAGVR